MDRNRCKGTVTVRIDLVDPEAVGVDDALRKPPGEPKCGRAVRERLLPPPGRLELLVEHVEVLTKRVKALEQFPPICVLGSERR